MLKENTDTVKQNGITYLKIKGRKVKFRPWLGDMFSFLYDSIMEKSIFPKKFEASIVKHREFLEKEYSSICGKRVLELSAGSGDLSGMLPVNNEYTGIDISEGLLKIAHKKFSASGFSNFELFLCSSDNLPFEDSCFDAAVCNLSINFFPHLEAVISELKRVLKRDGVFICSVPVPERNKRKSKIRGKLYSEEELKTLFENSNFSFLPCDMKNGTLLYFKALLKQQVSG